MSNLEEIKPKKKQRVIDLAQTAGLDVTDWANYAQGENKPGSNPKYCYEWSFVEPGKLVILNLWHDNLREKDGFIEQTLNFSEAAWHETSSIRKARRDRMREAALLAFRESLPVRVIILDGEHYKNAQPEKPNKTAARMLDPISWAVVHFDESTGEALFRRGVDPVVPSPFVDQFSILVPPQGATGMRQVTGNVYNRSSEVRRYVLERANGRCEYCHQPGFVLPDGRIFLETHHVTLLANGGTDNPANVVALCPNHHREAHHGKDADLIRAELILRLRV